MFYSYVSDIKKRLSFLKKEGYKFEQCAYELLLYNPEKLYLEFEYIPKEDKIIISISTKQGSMLLENCGLPYINLEIMQIIQNCSCKTQVEILTKIVSISIHKLEKIKADIDKY